MYTVEQVLGMLGWILGGAVALKAGIGAVADLIKMFRAPNNAQDTRLRKLEEHGAHVDECLEKDKQALDGMKQLQEISIRAQLALLAHGLDGNNQRRMEESKQEIEEYLIKR